MNKNTGEIRQRKITRITWSRMHVFIRVGMFKFLAHIGFFPFRRRRDFGFVIMSFS